MPEVAGVSRGPRQAKQQVRQDPRPRPLDGVGLRGLKRQDPDREYVLVGQSEEQIELYESLGYTMERYSGDGVSDTGGASKRSAGQPIKRYDCILMSIPKAAKARLEQEGPEGETGQQLTDQVERRIFNRKKVRLPDVTKGLAYMGDSGPSMMAETDPNPFGDEHG